MNINQRNTSHMAGNIRDSTFQSQTMKLDQIFAKEKNVVSRVC